MSAADAKIIKEEPLDPREARWTRLVKTTYTDPLNQTRDWESARRTTRPEGAAIDGVGILAFLVDPKSPTAPPRLLMQKQFRPPVGKVCIEVPAGLIDAGESAETCALRELREETGYIGRAIASPDSSAHATISPVMYNDPGFCNCNLQMVHVEIDVTAPENADGVRQTQLEENEFIECFSVELGNLYAECVRLEKEGYAIDARVGTLAEGIEAAKRWAGVLNTSKPFAA
ncbi:NUDIX hydrolase domain-like protein [Phyllosticta citrichinensis]|uniref:NUDIX hydrolase domain-like protein n=1 Tax=Phyllosticta citrichinensis TaxID=1130410 RepID=A0ABR1XJI4_9PEZI